MKPSRVLRAAAQWCALLLAGCGKPESSGGHDGHQHGDHHHQEDEGPARFTEGAGLQLSPETTAALGVITGAADTRTVRQVHELTASVFAAGPPARAIALVPPEIADDLEKHPPAEAEVLAIHRGVASALSQVEVVFAVTGNPAVGSTISLSLRGPARPGLAVPRSALLRTATGDFVYVTRGDHLLRTLVQPGARDGGYIQIRDGLRAGDVIATAGVEQLWLTELRLTKGGGHSH